jgi:hypothetical protein
MIKNLATLFATAAAVVVLTGARNDLLAAQLSGGLSDCTGTKITSTCPNCRFDSKPYLKADALHAGYWDGNNGTQEVCGPTQGTGCGYMAKKPALDGCNPPVAPSSSTAIKGIPASTRKSRQRAGLAM